MKIVLAVVLSLVFFALGLVGTYMAMPALAPDMVDQTAARLDSLAQSRLPHDPMMNAALMDSLGMPADSAALYAAAYGAMAPAAPDPAIATLRDSLQDIHFRLAIEQETQKVLQKRIAEMESRWEELQKRFDDARQMSGTLVKLEDGELGALLSQLDMDVIEAIYLEATARNRTRLLQMLPAEKASALVNKLATPQPALSSAATAPPPAPGN
ncbi:MAG: hypothetical protein R2834_21325 [Rhodothermales bacterium]